MTDQDMDARLRAAGERFRAATAEPATSVDVADVTIGRCARRSHLVLAVAAAVVVLLVVGLALGLRGSHRAAPPSADNAGLVGNVWLLTHGGKPSTTTLYVSRNGALVADDECELLTATVTVGESRLTITDPVVRPKPCLDRGYAPSFNGVGERVLRGTTSFHIDSRGMTITHAGVGSLRFALAQTPIPPPTSDIPTLTGTDWVAPDGKVLHIDPATGRLSGGWCSGRAAVDGLVVRFVGCPAGVRIDYGASISGSTLTLEHPPTHGRVATVRNAIFRWRPVDAALISAGSLIGRVWRLESVVGSRASSGSLRIADGIAVVDDGCSTYRRAVTVGAGTFTIAGHPPAHACSDQASTADSFLFNRPATWIVRGGKLIVYGGGSQAFALVYGSSAPSRAGQDRALLRAHPWQAPGPDHAVVTFTRTRYTIAHTCYSRTGSATFAADTIVFGPGRAVQHSCPAPASGSTRDEDARSIDAVLSGDVRWSVDGSELTLTANSGTLVLGIEGSASLPIIGHWVLVSIVPPGATAPAFPTPPVTFDFSTDSASAGGTKAVALSCTVRQIRFHQPWVDNLTVVRKHQLGASRERFLFVTLLQGVVSYHVSGRSLIIVKAGVGAADFTRRR